MKTVFISHAHNDQRYVDQLAASLKKEGVKVWSESQVQPGEDWKSALEKGLTKSDLILTVVSARADLRANAFFEAGAAIGMGKPVIFIVPESEVKSGRLPFDLDGKKALLRRTAAATVRDIMRSEHLELKEGRTARSKA